MIPILVWRTNKLESILEQAAIPWQLLKASTRENKLLGEPKKESDKGWWTDYSTTKCSSVHYCWRIENPITPYSKCKKMHRGKCLFNFTRACYNCGQEGYIAMFCKGTPTNLVEHTPNVRPNTCIYSLNENIVEARPSTSITSRITIFNLNLYVLIDSGATHSFIASRLIDILEGKRKLMTTHFIIKTPMGKTY